jgi:hypothetical protein
VFTGLLLCPVNCSKHFTCVNSFNPHKSSTGGCCFVLIL